MGECERGGVLLDRARRTLAALAFYKFERRREGGREEEGGGGSGEGGESSVSSILMFLLWLPTPFHLVIATSMKLH